ncbi:MAG TPA: hypothetical protein VGD49_02110, partial [Longimicrobiales bacterium]
MCLRPPAHNFWLKAKAYLYVLQVFRARCGRSELLNSTADVVHKFCTQSTTSPQLFPHSFNTPSLRLIAAENAENAESAGAVKNEKRKRKKSPRRRGDAEFSQCLRDS